MDAVRYKNDSREWLFKDNDLCKSKETSKSYKDADQSEYESNIEIFGEITIQFNNEVHLLYDGPVQIKCANSPQDYTFNCKNVVKKCNQGNVSKTPVISRKTNVTTNKRTLKKDVYSQQKVENYRLPTKPTIPPNLGLKVDKKPPAKYNKNTVNHDALCTKTISKPSEDVCSRTSQFCIPRRTILLTKSDLSIKPITTSLPTKNTNISSKTQHSTNATASVNKSEAMNQSGITKNIRATFNKLFQSNANSLQVKTAIDDNLKIINANLKQIQIEKVVKTNPKEILSKSIRVTNKESTDPLKNSQIREKDNDVSSSKSKLHEKILRGRCKTVSHVIDITSIDSKDVSTNHKNCDKISKNLPQNFECIPIKSKINSVKDNLPIQEKNKIVSIENPKIGKSNILEKENVDKTPPAYSVVVSNKYEGILLENEATLLTQNLKNKCTERRDAPENNSVIKSNLTVLENPIKVVSNEEKQVTDEVPSTKSIKFDDATKAVEINKLKTSTLTKTLSSDIKSQEDDNLLLTSDLNISKKQIEVDSPRKIISLDPIVPLLDDSSKISVSEEKTRMKNLEIAALEKEVCLKNCAKNSIPQTFLTVADEGKGPEEVSLTKCVTLKKKNETTISILANSSINSNQKEVAIEIIVENLSVSEGTIQTSKNNSIMLNTIGTSAKSTPIPNSKRKKKNYVTNSKILKTENNSDVLKTKTGVQKKLTQYFTAKSSDNDYCSNTEKCLNITNSDIGTKMVTKKSLEFDVENNTIQEQNSVCNDTGNSEVNDEINSSIVNMEDSQNVSNNECLRNISISVLEENQNSDQNKTLPTGESERNKNSPNEKVKKLPDETEIDSSVMEENLDVIQKENIPVTVSKPDNDAVTISKSKELTKIETTTANITKAKIIKERLRSKMKSTNRRITRSKRSKLVNIKRTANRVRKNSLNSKNNSLKSKNIVEDKSENENVVEVISPTEKMKSPVVNKSHSIKRETKPDETENIIRLDTIGTEIHTFHCKKCDKIFLRKSLLIKHEKEKHPPKKIGNAVKRVRKNREKVQCSTCPEVFSNERSLKLHKCSQRDSNLDNSTNDQNDSSIEEPTAKRICSENLDTELKVEEIIELKTESESPITDDQKDNSKSKKSTNKNFVCPHCNINMLSTNDLKVHVKRVHEKVKSKICPYCSRGFTCTGDLTRHIRLHTGEKPFKCTQKGCKMAFIASGDLIKHERTHLGDQYPRNFGCDICGKSFKQRYEHDRHIRTAHTSTIKQFECHLCKKQFGRKDGLMYHLRLHAGIKPYTCKTCGKQFTDSGNLKKHMNTRRHELPPKKKRNRPKKVVETDKQ